MSRDTLMNSLATGGIRPFERVEIPQTRSASIAARFKELHSGARALQADTATFRRRALLADLEDRQQASAALEPQRILNLLAAAGMSWKDVARLVGVSVPAVQKWRRGGDMTGANRLKLARVAALLDVLGTHAIGEQVSWLEMPVREGVAVSRMDLLAAGRFDLVLELISDDHTTVPVEGVLDEFDAEWRSSRVDSSFETFTDEDGVVAIRPAR